MEIAKDNLDDSRPALEPTSEVAWLIAKKALESGDSDSCFQALILALWKMNNPLRILADSRWFRVSHATYQLKCDANNILSELHKLLDLTIQGDLILSAELLRERSRYEECLDTLSFVDSQDLKKLSAVIKNAAERQLSIVLPYSQ